MNKLSCVFGALGQSISKTRMLEEYYKKREVPFQINFRQQQKLAQ